ncbi:DUF2955 domain-containing protein [Lysobacter niastensis]|uniref:DUF2955 domain-containing protein n=2 Tax=Lysobacter niastensis TaxID=380629 RepID=A0ABS0BE99_9GAMM|nr:DUF2955 domain-containing protein [Lysobacter niastensis]
MPLAARRTFRFGTVAALALALAYGLAMPLPFLAPLLAITLTAAPAPPMGPKGLLGLMLVVAITLGAGLVLTPVLRHYPLTGVMMIAAGLFVSTYMSVGLGKGAVATLLTIGITMIPAAGLMEHALARAIVEALLIGLGLAIVCQWIVYPFFPEDRVTATSPKAAATDMHQSLWIALRTTAIVLPPVLMALSNPSAYMAIIMKAVLLGQQGSAITARAAGYQLLGSTLLAGVFAFVFWFALKLWPGLWMFALWMLLFGLYLGGKLYGAIATRLPASFWINVGVTMLILIGPAVEDSKGGDVYEAFAKRFALFVAVTLYAWLAILVLERLRAYRIARRTRLA